MLNNKGFTLVEVLAVVVILSILVAIMVPSVNYLIEENRENNYESLKKSIVSAARIYVSDNRYDIAIDGTCSEEDKKNGAKKDVKKIGDNDLTENKISLRTLIDTGDLQGDKNGQIENPEQRGTFFDLANSYVTVQFNCQSKNYDITLNDDFLK